MRKLKIDKQRVALLVMDFQDHIVKLCPMADERKVLHKASRVLDSVRKVDITPIYIVLEFRNGYPEVSPRNKIFSGIKERGELREGTPESAICAELAPLPGEPIVVKRRVSAFYNTDLTSLLKARQIETLVMMGIATSGVVLSTVRYAADADYELIVLEDCCADFLPETHTVLVNEVLPSQATIIQSEEFLEIISGF